MARGRLWMIVVAVPVGALVLADTTPGGWANVLWVILGLGVLAGVARTVRALRRAARVDARRDASLLERTSPEQRYYLRACIESDAPVYIPLLDTAARPLRRSGILVLDPAGGNLCVAAYHLSHWARQYLVENPELLRGDDPSPRTQTTWMPQTRVVPGVA